MPNELKVGYVVQLRSGGPKMTVAAVEANGVWCKWFAGDEIKQAAFDPELLKIFE